METVHVNYSWKKFGSGAKEKIGITAFFPTTAF